MKKIRYEVIVFVCGALSMALELVAARIFSPYVGSSNLIWTVIIGMILIFMSIGYYVGGKLADKKQDVDILRFLLYVSMIYIAVIPILEVLILEPFAGIGLPLVLTAIIMSVLLFGFPSFVFAFVSPFSVKLKQIECDNNKDKIGEISGKMSAYSTIGSILGTFVTGFWLIPTIGTRGLNLLITILLVGLLIFLEDEFNFKRTVKNIISFVLVIGLFVLGNFVYKTAHPEVIRDVDSEYSRIQVKQYISKTTGEKVKALEVGNVGAESLKYEGTGTIGDYLYYYDLVEYYLKNDNTTDNPSNTNILMIGGAAYTYPTYLYEKEENKNVKMDVVEIDEVMTKLATQEFDLDLNNPSLDVIHQDGRSYINYTDEKYDAILVDAFKGASVPFELTTCEAAQKMYNILNENGLVITNILSSLEGKESDFLKYEYSTYKKVFDDVKVFYVDTENKEAFQNVILMGIKGKVNIDEAKENVYKDLLKTEVVGYTSDKDIVTDNLAQIGD